MKNKLILGSRGSRLALWQTQAVADLLRAARPNFETEIKVIETTGDAVLDTALSKIGDKGLFTRQIEENLLSGEIDLAVHSLKDLPTTLPEKLKLGAVTRREKPHDVLISREYSSIAGLPRSAHVATGSLRRRSQLLAYRPDLNITEIRGNVPTRLNKFAESNLDAMILAFAGLHRLALDEHIKQLIPFEIMLPAVSQGAIGLEIREDDSEIEELLKPIIHLETLHCVLAERAFLRRLEGGCQVPIAAHAEIYDDRIYLEGYVGSLNGEQTLRGKIEGETAKAEILGTDLANDLIEKGANVILELTRETVERTTENVI